MKRSFFPALAIAATTIAISLGMASTSNADHPVKHKEKAHGQVVLQIDLTPENPVGRQEFVAEGRATHMGRYTQTGGHNFYLDGSLDGEFTSTAADGSTISGTYFGTFQDIGGGVFRFDVIAIWLEGTGRLDGVLGIGRVVAFLDGATGKVRYTTDAIWSKP